MNFAMDIEKLNLANFVGKVMNKFMVVPDFFAKVKCTERFAEIHKTSPKTHISMSKAKILKPPQALLDLTRHFCPH